MTRLQATSFDAKQLLELRDQFVKRVQVKRVRVGTFFIDKVPIVVISLLPSRSGFGYDSSPLIILCGDHIFFYVNK